MRSQTKLVRLGSILLKHKRNREAELVLYTHVNKGKRYPYNSEKRGWRKP